MRHTGRCLLMLTMSVLIVTVALAQQTEITVNALYIEHAGYDVEDLKMLASIYEDMTGVKVNISYAPYQEALAKISDAKSGYDLFAIDQVWLADLASQGIIAPLDEYIKRETYLARKMRRDILPVVRNAFQYQNRLWATPFLLNFQVFYYNQRLLKAAGFKNPPTSLEVMVEQMKEMKKKGIVEYPWTDAWGQGEDLVCDFVWLTAAFGGELFDPAGKPIFDQAPGVQALTFMVRLVKEQLANPSILTHDALTAKDDFLNEQAAFTSNWLFMQGLLETPKLSEVIGQTMIGLLPLAKTNTTVKTASVSAFQGMALAAASLNQEQAWKWLEFSTSPPVQRAFVFEMPIWTSVQTSPSAILLDPTMALKSEQLAAVHHRPNIPKYEQVSTILQTALYAALNGKLEPAAALQQAKTQLEQ